MSRTLPSDVSIDPMPDGFTVQITDISRPTDPVMALKASVMIEGSRYELGLRPMRSDTDAVTAAMAELTQGVWRLQQLAVLGRDDLMTYASVNRHKGRPMPLSPS